MSVLSRGEPIGERGYASLWCKSNFSFLDGASHPDELVTEAARLGLRALALTDRDGVYGAVRAHVKARELGVHLVQGAEITRTDGGRVILLATDRRGYANLCRLITIGRRRSPKGESSSTIDEIARHAGGLVALWPGEPIAAPDAPASNGEASPVGAGDTLIPSAPREAFGDRQYALVTRHRRASDDRIEAWVRSCARRLDVPVVAGTEVLYHVRARRELHDVLTCVRHGVTLATAGSRTRANDEHALRSVHAFGSLFADDPDAVTRTCEIAERCEFSLSDIRYRYPSERLPDGTTSSERLAALTAEGARRRYPDGIPDDVSRQLRDELSLVRELEYDGYFLTMWDIVRFCRENDILCQGRGSAANSAVCFVLGITAVDPVRMGLLFERFLSRERGEPPDIDLDIEHDRREEVIQHVYDTYGRTHAAMVANVVRYRSRSALREVGKALGLPETTLDRFARMSSHYDIPRDEVLAEVGFSSESPGHRHLLRLALEIQDFPRHLSIHPGGFLLGHERVDELVPVENATMPGRTIIQWDKHDLEDLGLFKVDLLGLGALNVVHRAFDLIEQHEGRRESMATLPAADPDAFEMIQRADTVGVFQIESRAQMAMLPRLRPASYYDLVIEVSIVRPGPITGGMVHPYLRRRNGEEAVTYAHPSLEPILRKTLGVPIFQEQVMQLAIVAADYSPGEADQLRRDMAAWQRSGRIERHRERLISRMRHKGIDEEFAERVFEQIRGFGEYGFPESHAASFALIAYATAWLKCHHPAAFLCALLNAQPMGFYSPATLIGDARRHGVVVLPVDVTVSDDDCVLEKHGVLEKHCVLEKHGVSEGGARWPRGGEIETREHLAVRMGLRYVKGLSERDRTRILDARRHGGFGSLEDFRSRCRLDRATMVRLAKAGTLATFTGDRREAMWRGLMLDRTATPQIASDVDERVDFDPLTTLETVDWDYDGVGHSARDHPLGPLRGELTAQGLPSAEEVRAGRDGQRVRYAGLVICRQRPGTAGGVVFMTLEDETGFVNVVLWERVYEAHRLTAKTTSFLGVTGRLQVQSGVVHLVAETLWRPRVRRQPQDVSSRDFH